MCVCMCVCVGVCVFVARSVYKQVTDCIRTPLKRSLMETRLVSPQYLVYTNSLSYFPEPTPPQSYSRGLSTACGPSWFAPVPFQLIVMYCHSPVALGLLSQVKRKVFASEVWDETVHCLSNLLLPEVDMYSGVYCLVIFSGEHWEINYEGKGGMSKL